MVLLLRNEYCLVRHNGTTDTELIELGETITGSVEHLTALSKEKQRTLFKP